MTNKNEKIWLLLHALKEEFEKQSIKINESICMTNNEKSVMKQHIIIKRFHLKQSIQNKLRIVDTHTLNSWINLLLTEGFITSNPTSQLSSKKKLIKPTNDTRYVINIEEILIRMNILYSEIFPHTHSEQVNIDKFLSGSSDHRDIIMDNSSSIK